MYSVACATNRLGLLSLSERLMQISVETNCRLQSWSTVPFEPRPSTSPLSSAVAISLGTLLNYCVCEFVLAYTLRIYAENIIVDVMRNLARIPINIVRKINYQSFILTIMFPTAYIHTYNICRHFRTECSVHTIFHVSFNSLFSALCRASPSSSGATRAWSLSLPTIRRNIRRFS